MITTAQLLNAYAKKHGLATPYAIAKKLSIATPTIYRVLNEGKTLENRVVVKIADDLGIPWHKAVAGVEAERAKSAEEKSFWMKHAGFANVDFLSGITVFSSLLLFPSWITALFTGVYIMREEDGCTAALPA